MENVQRRATKILPQLQNMPHTDRLKELGIQTLEYRQVRSDLIQVYKILNGIDAVEKEMLFPINNLNQHHTRGCKQRIFKTHNRLLVRKNPISKRIVDHWNSLPEDIVNAHNLNSLKHS